MFEPVTTTSSMVTPGWPVVCGVGVGSCANVMKTGQKQTAVIAKHRPVAGGFIVGIPIGNSPTIDVTNLPIHNKRRFEDSSANKGNFCHVRPGESVLWRIERSRDIADYSFL